MQDDVRLIDANAFAREIVKLDDLRRLSTKTIGEALDRTPTIDAVPVVRCSECGRHKWWPTPQNTVFCTVWREWVKCDGFCHEGVQMEGGASDG